MIFLILFSFLRFPERYGCYLFSATGITSFRPLELTLCTKHRLNIKSASCLQFTHFCFFHPKVPSKHKTKNFKVFYRYNIGKTLVKCRWNYRIIWLHHIPSIFNMIHLQITNRYNGCFICLLFKHSELFSYQHSPQTTLYESNIPSFLSFILFALLLRYLWIFPSLILTNTDLLITWSSNPQRNWNTTWKAENQVW